VLLGRPWPVRLGAAVALVALPGFLLGMPFPSGLRALERIGARTLVPWVWGINGAMSVMASVAGIILAIEFGYTAVFLLGAPAMAGRHPGAALSGASGLSPDRVTNCNPRRATARKGWTPIGRSLIWGRFGPMRLLVPRPLESLAARIGVFVFAATRISALAVAGTSAYGLRAFLRSKIEQKIPASLSQVRDRLDLWYAQRSFDVQVFAQSATVVEGVSRLAEQARAIGRGRAVPVTAPSRRSIRRSSRSTPREPRSPWAPLAFRPKPCAVRRHRGAVSRVLEHRRRASSSCRGRCACCATGLATPMRCCAGRWRRCLEQRQAGVARTLVST
jgi:hypothetical protein